MLNEHPAELKELLGLHGKRKHLNEQCDPRWIYDAISQLREQNPTATVISLVRECMKQFPLVGDAEGIVRQKYYQGKKLAETGLDYKGRDRKRDISSKALVSAKVEEELDF